MKHLTSLSFSHSFPVLKVNERKTNAACHGTESSGSGNCLYNKKKSILDTNAPIAPRNLVVLILCPSREISYTREAADSFIFWIQAELNPHFVAFLDASGEGWDIILFNKSEHF